MKTTTVQQPYALRNRPIIERFWAKIIVDENDCWIWIASQMGKGYGAFRYDSKGQYAHRFSYEYYRGPIPKHLQLDHLCRVRLCANPEHLEAVTGKENRSRGVKHGRFSGLILCVQGHDDWMLVGSKGKRRCRTCRRQYSREYYLQGKESE